MKIEIKSVKEVGSCNFCQREIKVDVPNYLDRWMRQFPYTQVYEVEGNTIGFRICEDCAIEFMQKMLNLPMIEK